jgi:transposase
VTAVPPTPKRSGQAEIEVPMTRSDKLRLAARRRGGLKRWAGDAKTGAERRDARREIVVREYLTNGCNVSAAARVAGCSASTARNDLNYWQGQRLAGELVAIHTAHGEGFRDAWRSAIVKEWTDTDRSLRQVAEREHVSSSTIHRWAHWVEPESVEAVAAVVFDHITRPGYSKKPFEQKKPIGFSKVLAERLANPEQ